MKQYFTKYLPVEGNIFPKDKFIHTLYEGVIHTNEDVTPLKEHPDYKKVKLFLCSRDIQVGDELTHIRTGLKTKKQLGKSLSGEWIKVIGEISPDALAYVKEGDEFDENEIKYGYGIQRMN